MATGLFVGLVTLDLIYLTPTLPNPNQKLVALDYAIAAGGPATNAAITFQYLSNSARLMGVIGKHPVSRFAMSELEDRHIDVLDLQPDSQEPLPTSSILVTQSNGDRAVISINATRTQAEIQSIPIDALHGVDIVLIDGHQMAVGQAIAEQAKAQGIPIVIDAGSWKTGFEQVLAQTDYAICSANFRPPQSCESQFCKTDVLNYLEAIGVPHIAITNGAQPITWLSQSKSGRETGKLAVPQINPVDTVGAGDVFHGAFCHFILQMGFQEALSQAAKIAARACESFGTREWMQ